MSSTLRRAVRPELTVTARARFDQRVHGRRRRPWRLLLAVALLLAAVALSAWIVLATPLLGVDRVTVSGQVSVSMREVLNRAAIAPGTPLARVDTAAVAERVAGIARLHSVDVRRRWPATVAIVVVEREPLAAEPVGRGFSVLDHAGVPLERRADAPPGIPVLRISGSQAPAARAAALAVLDSLPPDVREQVTAARAKTPDDVTLTLDEDRTVVWGGADRARRKTLVLSALLGIPAEVYDVSAPNAPTTR